MQLHSLIARRATRASFLPLHRLWVCHAGEVRPPTVQLIMIEVDDLGLWGWVKQKEMQQNDFAVYGTDHVSGAVQAPTVWADAVIIVIVHQSEIATLVDRNRFTHAHHCSTGFGTGASWKWRVCEPAPRPGAWRSTGRMRRRWGCCFVGA